MAGVGFDFDIQQNGDLLSGGKSPSQATSGSSDVIVTVPAFNPPPKAETISPESLFSSWPGWVLAGLGLAGLVALYHKFFKRQ